MIRSDWRVLCQKNHSVDPVDCHLNRIYMTSRTGMEAEAITRLTDGLQPPSIRAILVQCLVGELAPSAAISRMLETEGAMTVRAAIDDVTHRAATISRASDMLVHDRVDELTQIFVEKVSELPDSDATKSRAGRSRPQAPEDSRT